MPVPQTRAVYGHRLLPRVVGRPYIRALAALLLLVAVPGVHAQEGTPEIKSLSAGEFLELLVESSPRLQTIAGGVDAAAAEVSAAGLWANPSIAYDREEVSEDGRAVPENFVRFDLPLEISGQRSLRTDGAEHALKAAQADAAAAKVALMTTGMRVYLHAAAGRQQLAALEYAHAALSRLRDSVRARTAAGDASQYDLARLEIEVFSLDDSIVEAKRELLETRLLMGMLLGKPGAQYDATDDLALATIKKLAALIDEVSADEQPDVLAATHRVTQHRLSLGAARRGWVPSLTLSGGAKTTLAEDETEWGYLAGVSLTLPIFDSGQADKARAAAEVRRAEADLSATRHRVATDIEVALNAFESATKQVESYEGDQLPRLEKLIRRAEVSYREGERPVFELLDAYRTAREVRLRHVDLRLQARVRHIDLLQALGREPIGTP